MLWVPGRRQFDVDYDPRPKRQNRDPFYEEDYYDEEPRNQNGRNEATNPDRIVLMTYVDLDDFKESPQDAEAAPDGTNPDGTQPPPTNNSGPGTGGTGGN